MPASWISLPTSRPAAIPDCSRTYPPARTRRAARAIAGIAKDSSISSVTTSKILALPKVLASMVSATPWPQSFMRQASRLRTLLCSRDIRWLRACQCCKTTTSTNRQATSCKGNLQRSRSISRASNCPRINEASSKKSCVRARRCIPSFVHAGIEHHAAAARHGLGNFSV